MLDRTVIAGYTNVGIRLRRHGWDPLPRMDGKLVLITGATSGLGLAAAEGFARLGAGVRLLVRDADRGESARRQVVAASGNSDVDVGLGDLSDLGSVREFAARFTTTESRLDVLINNAGVLPGERQLSGDGIELSFATNVIGPFLLTSLLTPLLRASAPARIINVSSGGMYTRGLDIDDLQSEHGDFDGPTVYARAKRAQVILSELWAERLRGTGVVVHAMHPGWADTPGLRSSLPRFHALTRPFLRTAQDGADTILWLGAADRPARSSGEFWHDRATRPTHRVPWTKESAEDRARLWRTCVELSGGDA